MVAAEFLKTELEKPSISAKMAEKKMPRFNIQLNRGIPITASCNVPSAVGGRMIELFHGCERSASLAANKFSYIRDWFHNCGTDNSCRFEP